MAAQPITIPAIIRNDAGIYRGDLRQYFRVVFLHAKNLNNPYHNFRHMLHVLWQCYDACVFYGQDMTPLEKRHLLIAALMHDFDHPGMSGDDDLNIERSVRALRKYAHVDDLSELGTIEMILRGTEYPHKVPASALTLPMQILRDADMSQSLSTAWLQQVIFGLSSEWQVSPLETLELEITFHKKLKFETEWARERYPQDVIEAKTQENKELLELLR